MTSEKQDELKALALRVREHIVRLSTDGGCFTGASLSCADLLVYLYADFLNISPQTLDAPDRDFLFLSKGHDVPALYGTFVELGFMPKERLANHLKANDSIYWHPNRSVPGVEFHSGSLGHLPSVGLGVALDNRMRGLKNRTIVITGDGELNEGSVWETVLVAAAQKLSNFTLVVDRNHFQANVATEDLIPLEPLGPKFEAFGWAVQRIDGHDFAQLEAAFGALPFSDDKPSVIICDTVRGRGLPSIEARADRWFCNFSADEVVELLKELHSQEATTLTSETLTVR
ncbi:transketolase [Hymenobacter nivis]|uniref:Transketolase n=1 Tax=Hymenobacter nivis TaxID=1850093 RepID=A0A2Z3GRS7_9BACT|nr:thiamine pyrophosphate-dependent enzyme [Hymenobacter nivis]AWM34417.1 transketolase [Hymenobacter nivis]